jgi:hypothetical protein
VHIRADTVERYHRHDQHGHDGGESDSPATMILWVIFMKNLWFD